MKSFSILVTFLFTFSLMASDLEELSLGITSPSRVYEDCSQFMIHGAIVRGAPTYVMSADGEMVEGPILAQGFDIMIMIQLPVPALTVVVRSTVTTNL